MAWLKRPRLVSTEPVLQNGWTGRVLFTREGNTVWMNVEGLDGSASSAAAALAIPTGYRPAGPLNERGLFHEARELRLRRWYALATLIISSGDGTGPLYGAASWRTADPMPSGGVV